MAKPIRVQTTKATDTYPKGAELGFASEKDAASVLGEGAFKVLNHQDGSAYEAPKKATSKSDSEK
jgi:hypothetical protein